MFLALAFGLFLAVPLVLLVVSLGRTVAATALGSRRTGDKLATAAPAARLQMRPGAPMNAVAVAAPTTRGLSRRTRPAVPGGNRRDYFGDTLVASRPLTTAGH